MSDKNCEPNVHTYTVLIDGTCEEKKMDKVRKLLDVMEAKGIVGDNIHKALTLLDKMMKMKLSPSVVTYNLLINGQCKHSHVDNAYQLICLTKENGVVPNEWTYSPPMEALCRRGSVKEAHFLLKENGIKVNEVIYTTLINVHFQTRKADLSMNLFKEMLTKDCLSNYCMDV
ncbi:hypothetical protein L2E82_13123 [Cichorium intybus]|uniref:Uncharacterized protein n=1 Tax=Cichorium intybus TaxID=13427 RepID=A0ACB9GIZ8_CICIN|nr:hypothetical protein L2E82_13123 [Cichorium intybus]